MAADSETFLPLNLSLLQLYFVGRTGLAAAMLETTSVTVFQLCADVRIHILFCHKSRGLNLDEVFMRYSLGFQKDIEEKMMTDTGKVGLGGTGGGWGGLCKVWCLMQQHHQRNTRGTASRMYRCSATKENYGKAQRLISGA